jgi:thiamine-phosphate pyrophosphorylase
MANDLKDCRLYGIVDLSYVSAADAPRITRAMIEGGVDLIQLRGKGCSLEELTALAAELHAITSQHATPLIINDHAEIARTVEVEGVHVGQDDLAVAEARRIAGRSLLVGKSTHSLAQAKAAEAEGADYIGFGPLFTTPTKPDYAPIGLAEIGKVHREVDLPIFCIGGIKLHNLPRVIAAGARKVVIVSGLLQSKDLAITARAAKQLLSAQTPIGNQKSEI